MIWLGSSGNGRGGPVGMGMLTGVGVVGVGIVGVVVVGGAVGTSVRIKKRENNVNAVHKDHTQSYILQ